MDSIAHFPAVVTGKGMEWKTPDRICDRGVKNADLGRGTVELVT